MLSVTRSGERMMFQSINQSSWHPMFCISTENNNLQNCRDSTLEVKEVATSAGTK